MKAKRLLGLVLFCVSWTGAAVSAQQPAYQPAYPPPSPLHDVSETQPTPHQATTAPVGVLSDWIVYRKDCCEGRLGMCTPLYTEAYLRAGPSIPVGGMTLSRELQTGWSITGGARFLLFNEPMTSAWVVDVHLINTHETAVRNGTEFPITIFRAGTREDFGLNGTPGATVKSSNRTLAGLGIGREWYLWEPADFEGRKCRVGADFGGRYGSHNLDFYETRHITDVIGSMYAAVHADVEFPCRNLILNTGVRLEWAYTWSDVLARTSDVQELSLFLSAGIRY
jgi:hypothetical protein